MLGLAVVIAPLMSAMPSKSQRAKAALRDQARACNLRVSLRPLPPIPARCLLYTSDAADDMQCVDLGGRAEVNCHEDVLVGHTLSAAPVLWGQM